MSAAELESDQERLAGVRFFARALQDSSDDWVWRVAQAIEQVCMGTITVAQAQAQLGEDLWT